MHNYSAQPTDAVIMWVDGSDPNHEKKLNSFLSSRGLNRSGSASKARFHDAGELDYCITSLLKYAPWLRTIFIVADEQHPHLLKKLTGTRYESVVRLIDHKIIFSGYDKYLPSFNSMAISSLLWRIPGIADNFLYLNDDFMLIRPVQPEDFFRDDKIVLRGKWHRLPESIPGFQILRLLREKLRGKNKKNHISYWGLQQSCARLLAFKSNYFRLPHTPHAWKKTSWQKLFVEFPNALQRNISSQLRGADQYVPEGLSSHFHLKNALAIIDNTHTNLQLKPTAQSLWRIKWKLLCAERNENIVFACVQSIELADEEKQKLITEWLNQRIGRLEDFIAG